MKKAGSSIFKRVYNYYQYHGTLETIKAIIRKLNPFYKNSYKISLEKMQNIDLYLEPITNNEIKKETKNVFIFATVPYFDVGGGQRSAQLAKIFNRMGFNVHYIYAFKSSEKNVPLLKKLIAK